MKWKSCLVRVLLTKKKEEIIMKFKRSVWYHKIYRPKCISHSELFYKGSIIAVLTFHLCVLLLMYNDLKYNCWKYLCVICTTGVSHVYFIRRKIPRKLDVRLAIEKSKALRWYKISSTNGWADQFPMKAHATSCIMSSQMRLEILKVKWDHLFANDCMIIRESDYKISSKQ